MTTQTAIEKTTPDTAPAPGESAGRSEWTYRPAVDIFDTADAMLLVADLPGANGDSINLTAEQGILTIQAPVPPRSRQNADRLIHEYGIGDFHRRFELDDSIDPEDISAEYRHGALVVRLPKRAESQRRRIEIKS